LNLDKIFAIFFADLHKPPVHKVQRAGQISVGRVKGLAMQFHSNGRPDSRKVSIIADPLDNNSAHALIQEKLPRKLALEIIDNLVYHEAPESNKTKKWWSKICKILFFPYFR